MHTRCKSPSKFSIVSKSRSSVELILENHRILADNAYPLRNWLISPVKNYGNLLLQTIRFNKKLSSARQTVERAFWIMKSRFRILRDMPLRNTALICKLILTTCILHNICIMHSDTVDEQLQDEDMDPNNCEGVFQNGVNGVLMQKSRTHSAFVKL